MDGVDYGGLVVLDSKTLGGFDAEGWFTGKWTHMMILMKMKFLILMEALY